MSLSSNEIFAKAQEQFLDSLSFISPQYKAKFNPCSSGAQLVDYMTSLDCISRRQRRWDSPVPLLERFVMRVESYFAAVDILVQVDPIHAGTIWGAVRIIFQLTSSYATFFDKFLNALEQLSLNFPIYDRIGELIRGKKDQISKRLNSSLHNLYLDLLQFFHSVIQLFFRCDGGPRNKISMFAKLIWKPFDATFGDTIEKIKLHHKVIAFELEVLQIELTTNMQAQLNDIGMDGKEKSLERMLEMDKVRRHDEISADRRREREQKLKDLTNDRLQAWLNTTDFDKLYDRSQATREDDTAYWLFDEPIFQSWEGSVPKIDSTRAKKTKFDSNTLWVHGNPGYGKTVLAAATIEELRRVSETSGLKSTVCYFFFEYGAANATISTDAYRAFLSQILKAHQDNSDVLNKYSYVRTSLSRGQSTATHSELLDLLLFCCQSIGNIYFVIDGLDECTDGDALVREMLRASLHVSVRLLFFSRPNVSFLRRFVAHNNRISIGQSAKDDIRLFLTRKMEELVDLDLLPEDIDIEPIVERLVRRTEGMFLWARLMVAYLSSPALTVFQRLDDIEEVNLPEGLETMYGKIVGLVFASNAASRNLAQRILTWLLYGYRDLTPKELEEALILGTGRGGKEADRYQNLTETVILTCGGLVERETGGSLDNLGDSRPFRIIHSSAKEYLLSLAECNASEHILGKSSLNPSALVLSEHIAHVEMATTCLRFLSYRMPAQPLSGAIGKDINRENLSRSFPFCGYASVFWVQHLVASISTFSEKNGTQLEGHGELIVAVSNFLLQRLVLMAWIEASYTEQVIPFARGLQQWGCAVERRRNFFSDTPVDVSQVAQEVIEFSKDLDNLHKLWGSKLIKAPGCIWEEVTAFTPSRFLAKTAAIKVESLISDHWRSAISSQSYIKKISQTTEDGVYVSVLSIWPSRDFEKLFGQEYFSENNIPQMFKQCSGWIAKYEVYAIESSKILLELEIPLSEDEVSYQLEQSLWFQNRKWTVHFPLSVCPDGRVFAVLRTIYKVIIRARPEYESHQLPLESCGSMKTEWDLSKQRVESSQFGFGKTIGLQRGRCDRNSCHNLYTIWVFFSRDGRYACIVDQKCGSANSIAIFDLLPQENEPPRLIISHEIWLREYDPDDRFCLRAYWDDRKDFCTAFHSTLSILAIGGHKNVYLWRFNQVDEMPRVLASSRCVVKRVGFSGCGQYIVVDHGFGTPTVLPLPPWARDSNALCYETTASQYSGLKTEGARLVSAKRAHGESSAVTKLSLSDPNTLSLISSQQHLFNTNSLAIQPNGSIAPTQVSYSNTTVRLHHGYQTLTGSSNESLTLSLLPAWAGIDNVNIDVKLPRTTDEHVKIILNMAAEPWSGMTKPVEQHLPAIVTRDQRSFRQADVAVSKGKILRQKEGDDSMEIGQVRKFGGGANMASCTHFWTSGVW